MMYLIALSGRENQVYLFASLILMRNRSLVCSCKWWSPARPKLRECGGHGGVGPPTHYQSGLRLALVRAEVLRAVDS